MSEVNNKIEKIKENDIYDYYRIKHEYDSCRLPTDVEFVDLKVVLKIIKKLNNYKQKECKVTLEQAREKFDARYPFLCKIKGMAYCLDVFNGYIQALKDFNILEEGE